MEKDKAPRAAPPNLPSDDTVAAAVARMAASAKERGHTGLVTSTQEWQALALEHLPKPAAMRYIQAVLDRAGQFTSGEELQEFADLVTNIWNNAPRLDRRGRSANELTRPQRPASATP